MALTADIGICRGCPETGHVPKSWIERRFPIHAIHKFRGGVRGVAVTTDDHNVTRHDMWIKLRQIVDGNIVYGAGECSRRICMHARIVARHF